MNVKHHRLGTGTTRRRLEDIEYWRERAGWFDDDESMKEYNNGVYDAYYQGDDGAGRHSRSGGGRGRKGSHADVVKTVLKVIIVLVAIGLCVLMFRAIMRRISSPKKEKVRSDSKSRSSRSKSRSRSRSRSRKSGAAGDYSLMEDQESKSSRSKRSSRSKSRTRRSRSRSRTGSRSRSRPKEAAGESPKEAPVLV